MQKIKMADPHFTEADRVWIHQELDNILDGALSMGPNVKAFEEAFAMRLGVKYAIAMNSCTATLEAALLAKNVEGKEVIIPAQTFIATGMAVHLAGGKPIFAEISPSTLCLDFEDVQRKVTPQTAGVILVHMAGLITPDVIRLRQFCDAKGLFLIEDAAHAPGARLNGFEAGSLGHVGCFSFFPTKVMTAGEGGMLTTNDESIAIFARSLQHRGRDMQCNNEQYVLAGRNVRMTEMAALLGRVQLSHLDEYLFRRRQIAAIYKQELNDFSGVHIIYPEQVESSSFWKIPLLLDSVYNRSQITQQLFAANVAVDWAYQPALHLQPFFLEMYKTSVGQLPITEALLARHICLPCHPRMTDEDVMYVLSTLKHAIRSAFREKTFI